MQPSSSSPSISRKRLTAVIIVSDSESDGDDDDEGDGSGDSDGEIEATYPKEIVKVNDCFDVTDDEGGNSCLRQTHDAATDTHLGAGDGDSDSEIEATYPKKIVKVNDCFDVTDDEDGNSCLRQTYDAATDTHFDTPVEAEAAPLSLIFEPLVTIVEAKFVYVHEHAAAAAIRASKVKRRNVFGSSFDARIPPVQLRSGREYSPFEMAPVACPPEVDVEGLLKSAFAHEAADQQEDDPGVLADVQSTHSNGANDPVAFEAQGHTAAPNDALNQRPMGGDMPFSVAMTQSNSTAIADQPEPPAAKTPAQEMQKQSRCNRQRKRKREAQIAEEGYVATPYVFKRHIKPARAVKTDLKVAGLPATSCGYAALNERLGPRSVLPAVAKELTACGYELIPNDGVACRPLVGYDGTVYAVIAGRPNDASYAADQNEVAEAMCAAGGRLVFRPNQLNHKRGDFPAINVGVSHARGTTQPVNLQVDDPKTIDGLLALPAVQRMVKFANGKRSFDARTCHC
ncbi:hypothetical protein HYPSUDRAFT_53116 [Hypholoma sublateritium FD-334 SS-4]|uniref:Uncharacterized protein n=1 Tax=Hypholoma sublateritium (strain FD-334 SS-4) TaxID=945553 RepID=A0A0D2PAK3_HYPSF|nr:hypothetical protein HYPSUDRAFT_53116 [Hypholoma sublateritium FD-334 SS-4]